MQICYDCFLNGNLFLYTADISVTICKIAGFQICKFVLCSLPSFKGRGGDGVGGGVVELGFRLVALVHGAVEGVLGVFNGAVIGGVIHGRHIESGALVARLQGPELFLGLLKQGLVALAEDEEHVADIDLLAHLDHDGTDGAGLLGLDLVLAGGGDGAGAAHLGDDVAALDGGGGDLGQAPVHDGIGEKGQHKQHRQKEYGGVLDPFTFFDSGFHAAPQSSGDCRCCTCLPQPRSGGMGDYGTPLPVAEKGVA